MTTKLIQPRCLKTSRTTWQRRDIQKRSFGSAKRSSHSKVGVLITMDKFLIRTYDRKPMKVKKTVQKKMRQSTLHACKKVVILEKIVASLKHELDDIVKVLIPRNANGSQEVTENEIMSP